MPPPATLNALSCRAAARHATCAPTSRRAPTAPLSLPLPARRATRLYAKRSSGSSPPPPPPPPAALEKPSPLPPTFRKSKADEPDMWEGEQFDTLGKAAGQFVLAAAVLGGLAAGIVASSSYNEGAVGVDFQEGGVPQEAVAKALKAAGAK